jgi:hypothetical protein
MGFYITLNAMMEIYLMVMVALKIVLFKNILHVVEVHQHRLLNVPTLAQLH